MSEHTPSIPTSAWHRSMAAHAADEEHHTATVLEPFFDRCFVVAVAQSAAGLHHQMNDRPAQPAMAHPAIGPATHPR